MTVCHAATLRAVAVSALIAAGCADGGRDGLTDEMAARADSSAAGYEVGTSPSRVVTSQPPPDTTTPMRRAAAPDTRRAAPTESLPVRTDSARPVARVDSTRPVARVDSGRPARDTATPPRPAPGPVSVNEFLTFDGRTKTVTVTLVAGYNGVNNSLNFNGGVRGAHGVTVPTGWAVHIGVTNRDADLQHSAVVVPRVLPPPAEMPAPVFAGARTENPERGIHTGDTMAMFFLADRAGDYMIACGVPGHAQGGEWMRLTISASATGPVYR